MEDHTDRAPAPDGDLFLVQRVDENTIDDDFAGGGAVDPGDHVDQRRFAAARFADDRDKRAQLDLQVHTFEGGERTGGAYVRLHHLLQVDQTPVKL